MVRLEDRRVLQLFNEALSEWNCDGFVIWKKRAAEWLDLNMDGHSTKLVTKLMFEHLLLGGKIDQVRERRPEYSSLYEFHYDFRLTIAERPVYIETVLNETRTGPVITIVSMHDE
jgi:hypothetical protein